MIPATVLDCTGAADCLFGETVDGCGADCISETLAFASHDPTLSDESNPCAFGFLIAQHQIDATGERAIGRDAIESIHLKGVCLV